MSREGDKRVRNGLREGREERAIRDKEEKD